MRRLRTITGTRLRHRGPIQIRYYASAKYQTTSTVNVCNGLGRTIASRRLRSQIRIIKINYVNFYNHNPLIRISPSRLLCRRIAPSRTTDVVRTVSNNATRPVRKSIGRPFFTQRVQIIQRCDNGVSPRHVRRCVTINNCRSLRGTVCRVAPTTIISRVSGDNLQKQNNNNCPAKLG